MNSPLQAPAPHGWRRLLTSMNAGSLGVSVGFAVVAAMLFSQFFMTPFVELLARTLFVAGVLLLAFIAVQRWPEERLPRWLPRWVVTLVAMVLLAPLATFAMYLMSVGGDVMALVENPARVRGFLIIAGTALVLGMIITLSALLRQRDAEARALALRFALERSQLERQALDARVSLLQAQIQPHFLFNTLANVQALVESNSPRASEVLKSLIAYLRAAMPRLIGGPATLADEAQLVRAYLALMQMRMPDRLGFSVGIDEDCGRCAFPPLALLTLVENAVQHGVDPSVDGGRIEVGARCEPGTGQLQVWVEDSGVGMDAHAQPGTGLTNLRARLAALYGPAAQLILSERAPHGLRAELQLPADSAGGESRACPAP